MNFNKDISWLRESEEENLLEDDELDIVEPDKEINEANGETYVDDNGVERYVGNHKAVDNTAKLEPAEKDKKPAKKEQPEKVKAGKRVDTRDIKAGQSYVSKEDLYYGDLEDFEGIYDENKLRELGFVNDNNEVVIPAGTELKYQGFNGGAETFDIGGEEFDMSLDDVELYEAEKEEQPKQEPKKYEPSKEVVNLSSTIRDDIMSAVDQLEKEGKKYSLKQLMQKKLSGYSDKLASDEDKKYINGAAKYLYRLMTDRQPNFDFDI